MIIRIRIGHWRFTFTLYQITDITGVNSQLKDGNHILMWDFDDIPLEIVQTELSIIQSIYDLPNIYILNTGKPNHYIAYSFAKCSWRLTVEILAATPYLCEDYFKWGVFRKRFTLRVTPKENRKPKLVALLYSKTKEDVNISELTSWVKDTLSAKSNPFYSCPRQACLLGNQTRATSPSLGTSAQNMRHSQTKHQCEGGN
jgi:hypothetical protein